MDKLAVLIALIFSYFAAQVLFVRLLDLSILTVNKSLGIASAFLKGTFSLALVILKQALRISVRLWRYYADPYGIHVRINPVRTDNELGHLPTQRLNSGRRQPVIIEHETIR